MQSPIGLQQNVSLKERSTWKVGGSADFFVEPDSIEQLTCALAWAAAADHPVSVLSGGSNVLISDDGVEGLVISMRHLNSVERGEVVADRFEIQCLAGASKAELLKRFLKQKLSPALFLAGLPGDVGGGVVMNAGVGDHVVPREFCEITDWIEVLPMQNMRRGAFESSDVSSSQPMAMTDEKTSQLVRLSKDQLHWEYRHSSGWQPGVIVRACLSWPNTPEPDIMTKIKLATKKRLSSQPLTQPSCGSTFRNPEGGKSGQLIEQCGLKGFKVGGAQVSQVHANFIVTEEGASAKDVRAVIEHVQATVKEKTGFELQTEIILFGRW